MKLYKNIYYQFSNWLPSQIFNNENSSGIILPYQHTISDITLPHIRHLYQYKNIKQFKLDLEILLKEYNPIHPSQLFAHIKSVGKLPSDSFLLTFDDGLKEVSDIIAPILLEKGIPAIFFINPGFIDNKVLFYRMKISILIDNIKWEMVKNNINALNRLFGLNISSLNHLFNALRKINQTNAYLLDEIANIFEISFENYLNEYKPFMNYKQIKNLSEKGFLIGAHSWDHPYYKYLSLEDQIKQTLQSCKYVKTHFNPSILTFAFPHDDTPVSQDFFNKLFENNESPQLLFGIQNQKLELNNRMLHRFNAERTDINFKKQLKGVKLMMKMRHIFKNESVIRIN